MEKCFTINNHDIEGLRSIDSRIELLIDIVGKVQFECISDPFLALVNSIVYQQLSFKAANAIWKRVELLAITITPERILDLEHENLRACGVSNSKVGYIKNIAKAFIDNSYSREYFISLSDRDVVSELVKIKGIGSWTADMFLMFCLGRKNVLSFADLSLKNGIRWLYEIEAEMNKSIFNEYYQLFSPYCTLASLYIWKIQELKLDKNENIYNL